MTLETSDLIVIILGPIGIICFWCCICAWARRREQDQSNTYNPPIYTPPAYNPPPIVNNSISYTSSPSVAQSIYDSNQSFRNAQAENIRRQNNQISLGYDVYRGARV